MTNLEEYVHDDSEPEDESIITSASGEVNHSVESGADPPSEEHDGDQINSHPAENSDAIEEAASSGEEPLEQTGSLPSSQPIPSGITGKPFTRATLGGALLALDTLSERLEQAELEADMETTPRRVEDVLIPMSEWDERFGESPDKKARYLMLGMMADARSKAETGGLIIHKVSLSVAGIINSILDPFRRSRTLSPVRRRFNFAVKRGESQVNRWINLGRVEDLSSRRLAQSALNQAADDTMDELVENQRIQFFIQDIVQAQSQGMIEEAIEEVRERAISSDNFVESPIRRLFRRPPRDIVPGPDFNPQLVRAAHKRHLPLRDNSLMAYYAGFVSRLLAFALDLAFLTIFIALGSWLLSTMLRMFGFQILSSIREATSMTDAAGSVSVTLSGTLLVIGYILGFWILTGQTLGMMLMGLRVVSKDGGRVTVFRAVLRLTGMIIASFPLYLGFVWILGDNRRQGWQDKIAGTYVVYSWDAQPDETFLTDYLFRQY